MKRLFASIALLLCAVAASAQIVQFSGASSGGGSYVGFLDTYSAQGATWGFSTYKLANAYGGNFAIVERQSDSTTTSIGFDAAGKANVTTFNSFCSGTNCYVSTLYDQVNGINATQATFANMPRIFVDTNGVLAICPQPGSHMATSYSATVNTAKQHLFVVARAAYADNRYSQAGVPTVSVTGNVTSGSAAVSSMSSQVGISTANNQPFLPTYPGVVDSANYLPNSPTVGTTGATLLSALPTGSTATLAFAPSSLSPIGSQTGDTLTFTNAVLAGAWIVNGPSNSSYTVSGYWGVGLGSTVDADPGSWQAARNAGSSPSSFQDVIGEGMRGQWGVYDFDTYTTQLNYNGVNLGTMTGSSANITYSTNVGMTLFADTAGAEQTSNACFETMVLFPATEASRVAMANSLMTQAGISFPFAPTTSDGFTMTGIYNPSYTHANTTVYGAYSVGPDALGFTWNLQSGGYTWPSLAYANNVNNTATLYRFIDEQGDSDVNITQAERTEISMSGVTVAPGQSFSEFYQFKFEQLSSQGGDWCYTGQTHYNNVTAGASSPDIVAIDCKSGQLQFVTQKTVGGNPQTTNCGSPLTLTVGTTYAVVITGFWSSSHSADTLTINAGTNGGSLGTVCSLGASALWDNDTGAYLKAGIYRGYPWSNAGTAILRVMNPQFSATANAYASYITSQPALPTHP